MTAFMPLAIEKDLRRDLMATGRGSLSMRCTGVQETIERQHRSWRLKTEEQDEIRKRNMDVMTQSHVKYTKKFNCRCEMPTVLFNTSFQYVLKHYYSEITNKWKPSRCPVPDKDFYPCTFLTVSTKYFLFRFLAVINI